MLKCYLCPKKCGANRPSERGLCGAGALTAARASAHYYEEPPISGKNGSGAVFFSGCPLGCVFCQNYPVSHGNAGKELTVGELADVFKKLCDEGCHNINLVSPTPYVPQIIKALEIARPEIPVVYNTSGYERVSTLKALDGYVDIYLPDFKYATSAAAERYSGAPDYPEAAAAALHEMIRQKGGCEYGADGMMTRGVVVRHLVLPSNRAESVAVLRFLSENYDKKAFLLSLMSQYVPMYGAVNFPEINRKLTKLEYRRVCEEALRLGFDGFFQEPSSQSSSYTPEFDLTGL